MAARNSAAEIKIFWEPPGDVPDPDITTVAEVANRFVNNNVQGKQCAAGQVITEAQLKDVELYYTCYLLSVRKAPVVTANVLNTSGSRQGGFSAIGMAGNQYGQMALNIDCTGTLRDIVARANSAAQGNVEDSAQGSFLLTSEVDLKDDLS